MSDDDTLSLEEALAQNRETIPDDENVVHIHKEAPSPSTDDDLERNLDFINKLLKRIRVDSFNATAAAVNEAKAHLQTDNVKINIAVANLGFDGSKQYGYETQLQYGDLRVKRDEIYEIAKRLLSGGYAAWKADINNLEKTARLERYNGGQVYTAFTTPRGKYLVLNKDGAPVPCSHNAITALRDHLASHNITILYDHWRNAISLHKDQTSFPRESKEFVVKNFVNEIYESTKVLYTIEHVKFAMGQLAVLHQQHSLLDYWDKLTWDRVDRIGKLVVDIMKLEGTEFQIAVITKQLTASVRRVKFSRR
jgi:hypothetical protein